jgi:outer membrane protein assembly factor BamB
VTRVTIFQSSSPSAREHVTRPAPIRSQWVYAVIVVAVLVTSSSSFRSAQMSVAGTAPPGMRSWAPWPQAQHDARHSGTSVTSGPTAGKVVWQRTLAAGPVPAGPVVGNGNTAYLTGPDGYLHAIDLATGKDRWATQTGSSVSGDLSVAPLVLPDGDIVTGVSNGLSAWAAVDGRRVWQVDLGGGGWTSPVTVDGSRIWVGNQIGRVAAVTVFRHRATRAWTLQTTSSSYGSVVTNGDGRLYTTSTTGLVAIDDTGPSAAVAWRREPHDGMVEVSAGLSATGVALLGTNGHSEWAYDRAGRQLWRSPRRQTYSSPSVTADGLAYVAEQGIRRIHVFDVMTGKEVGLYRSPGEVWTSVVVDAHHALYFATRSHRLIGLRANGTRLFSVHLDSSTSSYPALTGDGHLLIATDSGNLFYVR